MLLSGDGQFSFPKIQRGRLFCPEIKAGGDKPSFCFCGKRASAKSLTAVYVRLSLDKTGGGLFATTDSKCERQDKTSVLFDKIERFFCHVANLYAIVAHKRTFKCIVYSVFPIFGDSVIADCGAYYGTYGCAVTIGIEACADS